MYESIPEMMSLVDYRLDYTPHEGNMGSSLRLNWYCRGEFRICRFRLKPKRPIMASNKRLERAFDASISALALDVVSLPRHQIISIFDPSAQDNDRPFRIDFIHRRPSNLNGI